MLRSGQTTLIFSHLTLAAPARPPWHQRVVLLLDLAPKEGGHQQRVRTRRLGQHHHAARPAVQPMHHPRVLAQPADPLPPIRAQQPIAYRHRPCAARTRDQLPTTAHSARVRQEQRRPGPLSGVEVVGCTSMAEGLLTTTRPASSYSTFSAPPSPPTATSSG
eukprot:3174207-Rhodomonas_salina.2